MKIQTIPYKGSKRKLLNHLLSIVKDTNTKTIFDGFSGTGIVSAFLRSNGYIVHGNDLSISSDLYGKVFLQGYDEKTIEQHIKIINNLEPIENWLTENYSGTKSRIIRGTNGNIEERPLAFIKTNAMKLDVAREYIENVDIGEREKNALLFSMVLSMNDVFNNPNDQKSSLKKWTQKSLKPVIFKEPTSDI